MDDKEKIENDSKKSTEKEGLSQGEIGCIIALMLILPIIECGILKLNGMQPTNSWILLVALAICGVGFWWACNQKKLDTTGYDKECYIQCRAAVVEMKVLGAILGAAGLSDMIHKNDVTLTFIAPVAGYLLFLIGIHCRRLHEVIYRYEENAKTHQK